MIDDRSGMAGCSQVAGRLHGVKMATDRAVLVMTLEEEDMRGGSTAYRSDVHLDVLLRALDVAWKEQLVLEIRRVLVASCC